MNKYQKAEDAARQIADLHRRGDHGGRDRQLVQSIDEWVGRFDARNRVVWPAAIAALAGMPERAPVQED